MKPFDSLDGGGIHSTYNCHPIRVLLSLLNLQLSQVGMDSIENK